METIICIKSKEKIFLNQDLKNQEVESKINAKIAKGVSNIKILTIIYLKEYERTKFKREKDNVLFISPSIEKIFMEFVLIEIFEFIFKINSEKQIFLLKSDLPKLRIAKETFKFKSKISSIIKKEKFIQIPNIISLKIKLEGFSVGVYVR